MPDRRPRLPPAARRGGTGSGRPCDGSEGRRAALSEAILAGRFAVHSERPGLADCGGSGYVVNEFTRSKSQLHPLSTREAGVEMRATAIVTGLGLVLAACGGEKKPEPAAEAGRAAPPAAPAATAATHDVNMVLEGTTYKFVPNELTIKVGDKVVFHNVSGGPHNVQFFADSIPSGAQS